MVNLLWLIVVKVTAFPVNLGWSFAAGEAWSLKNGEGWSICPIFPIRNKL